jgi:hypothetical protein
VMRAAWFACPHSLFGSRHLKFDIQGQATRQKQVKCHYAL